MQPLFARPLLPRPRFVATLERIRTCLYRGQYVRRSRSGERLINRRVTFGCASPRPFAQGKLDWIVAQDEQNAAWTLLPLSAAWELSHCPICPSPRAPSRDVNTCSLSWQQSTPGSLDIGTLRVETSNRRVCDEIEEAQLHCTIDENECSWLLCLPAEV